MNRDDFERMCQPMMDKVKGVLEAVKTAYPGEVDSVEVVGGACRVPWFKKMCSDAFGKELSTTMNADESVARGCALQAAILSPLYKVRDFKVEDATTNGISVGWMGTAADAETPKDDDGDTVMAAGEGDFKTATVFPAGSLCGIQKLMTFFRKGGFDVNAQYVEGAVLPALNSKELGTYKIELPPQAENKKIKVRAEMTLNGIFKICSAEMVEVEEYEETVKEKRELPPDPAEEAKTEDTEMKAEGEGAAAADDAMKTDGEGADAAKTDSDVPMTDAEQKPAEEPKKEEAKKEPKYEWVDVMKKKKRNKRTELKVEVTGAPGLPAPIVQKLQDEESAMQSEMRDIIETDEKRNDLEGYIFNMRDKISSSGQFGEFITDADREAFNEALTKTEDWLYDTYDAKKLQYIEKLDELKEKGSPVEWRFKESEMRPEWIAAVLGTVGNYRAAAENPGEKYGHIAAEKLGKISAACNELEKWVNDQKAAQDKIPKTEKPVLVCADMEKKNVELSKMADEILKEPKPAPPKEEKKPEEEKKEEKPEEAPAEGTAEAPPADGPQNMDVD